MPSPFRSGSFLDRLAGGSSQQRSMPFPDDNYFSGYGRPALFRPKESLKAYGDNVWLYSAVNVHADELARTQFRLQKRNTKGEIAVVDKHQAMETMRRPQVTAGGKSQLTGLLLKKITAQHLLLDGEAFWLLQDRLKVNGAPTRIDLLLPECVFTKKDSRGDLSEYVYRLPDREIRIAPTDVVHFKLPDPSRWERGHAPTQAIRYALDTDKEAALFNFKKFLNNAIPGGLLRPKQNLGEPQMKKLREQWEGMHRGSDNGGRTAIMPADIEFQTIGQSNQEMQFVEGKKVNMTEILANYRVGPEMLGKTEGQTRANADAAIYVYARFGSLPFLEAFADTLTNEYLPQFPGTDGMEYGFKDPVPENADEKRSNATTLFASGAVTPNELRKEFGMEPLNLPGMDVPYVPFNVSPVGEPVTPNLPATGLAA